MSGSVGLLQHIMHNLHFDVHKVLAQPLPRNPQLKLHRKTEERWRLERSAKEIHLFETTRQQFWYRLSLVSGYENSVV